ncbi:MAG: hypothetical protein B6D58_03645 [candidate division Zixibacteria bacterium 4484_95]|nr:MAG: hypothetical protein B6D58_03645 [candidate division Zixibacteria bacterium 4484_95]
MFFDKRAIKASLPRGEALRHFIGRASSGNKPLAIAATKRRLVICKKGFFKRNLEEHPWGTLSNVSVDEGLFKKSSLVFKVKNGDDFQIDNIRKRKARNLCGYARQMIGESKK